MGCCFSYLINLCNDETTTVHNYTVESFHTTRYPSRGIYYRLCVEYNDNLL